MFARWRGMKDGSAKRRTLTPVERGRIVQRVIVDGWTSAEAASAFSVRERLIIAWVADYRRYGMASLRDTPGKTAAAIVVQRRLLRPVRAVLRRLASRVPWFFAPERPAAPSPLLRSNDDRRGGGGA
jgi:transposase-like protein